MGEARRVAQREVVEHGGGRVRLQLGPGHRRVRGRRLDQVLRGRVGGPDDHELAVERVVGHLAAQHVDERVGRVGPGRAGEVDPCLVLVELRAVDRLAPVELAGLDGQRPQLDRPVEQLAHDAVVVGRDADRGEGRPDRLRVGVARREPGSPCRRGRTWRARPAALPRPRRSAPGPRAGRSCPGSAGRRRSPRRRRPSGGRGCARGPTGAGSAPRRTSRASARRSRR